MFNIERRAKSSGLILVVQGLSQKQRQLMQQYFETSGLARTQATVGRERGSLKRFEHSVEVWKDWIRLKKEIATLGEWLPPAESLPAKRKELLCSTVGVHDCCLR